MDLYQNEGCPVTIVRPSHTYNEKNVPLSVHGKSGSFQVIRRIMDDKPVLIQGDGTSLWEMTDNRDFAIGFMNPSPKRLMWNFIPIMYLPVSLLMSVIMTFLEV